MEGRPAALAAGHNPNRDPNPDRDPNPSPSPNPNPIPNPNPNPNPSPSPNPNPNQVFLRDCVGCTFSVAAKQLRLRNVLRSEVRVFVDQPEAFIVEASDRLKVGNYP